MGENVPAFEAWIEQARGADILAAARRLGAELKRQGSEWVGPCPMGCSQHDGFSVNPRKRMFNCRKGGHGGDVIGMVRHVRGCDFSEAVAWLTDESMPSRSGREAAAHRKKRAAALEAEDNAYRAKQIKIARAIWERGAAIEGTPAEVYLRARELTVLARSPEAVLRFAAAQAYWRAEDFTKDEAKPIYVGPAMLAAVTDNRGDIVGCHITWFDPDCPGKKLEIADPAKPGELLPAKKMRGSKRCGAIKLSTPREFTRLVIGEGIETTGTLLEVEQSEPIGARTAFWASIDLGHLGGKAKAMVEHPDRRRAGGKALMVPGPIPEAQPARDLVPPEEVTEIVLLGDGDSDRFTTEMALRRACARWERPGRTVKIAWAPEGTDFNDLLRQTREGGA